MPARFPFTKLPLTNPAVRRSYQAAFRRVLQSGRLILGAEVAAFEQEFARFCGARNCVTVGNGTDALQIALRLSGVEPCAGGEVITTPLTASFTAHAIVAAGAKPAFADVDPRTLLISPPEVARAVRASTVAVVPVHLYGQACDLDALKQISRQSKLTLVQDAAQAHGTLYRGRPLADFTDISCYSFYPTKNLGGLGDGGALVTNNAKVARHARLFRDGGRAGSHVAQVEAVNSRLDELQAAFLRNHLATLEQWNRKRAMLADVYDELLAEAGIEEIRPVEPAKDSRSFNHLYVIRVGSSLSGSSAKRLTRRERLMDYLSTQGIETGIHYEHPLHLQPAFRRFGYARGDFPQAESACNEILSLPMHPFLSNVDVRRVVKAIGQFFRK